ncbi:MAG: ATP-binding cassette domain-containing protein [Candidatus Omnitrophica bacterium]|jgi:phospholipid/cholesterol/gamma-HCH transport system ATP-binding protein|nr:ATP-binding cassette domain-containing protein [Candidatus Omnitrophota bacterium]
MMIGEVVEPVIEVKGLSLDYDGRRVLRDINFQVGKKEIFIVAGSSGCGKSTLLKSLIGLKEPEAGKILYRGVSFWDQDEISRQKMMRGFGVLYQGGALWSSFTLQENVALPLQLYSDLSAAQIRETVELKLALVGLSGYGDFYPAQISGGMCKRAALARAIALDPEVIFFDEPSAGLDPVSSRTLDDLILQLRDTLDATIVAVSHELASIFAVGDRVAFLDAESGNIIAVGDPRQLRDASRDDKVVQFLTRGSKEPDNDKKSG